MRSNTLRRVTRVGSLIARPSEATVAAERAEMILEACGRYLAKTPPPSGEGPRPTLQRAMMRTVAGIRDILAADVAADKAMEGLRETIRGLRLGSTGKDVPALVREAIRDPTPSQIRYMTRRSGISECEGRVRVDFSIAVTVAPRQRRNRAA